MIRFLLHLILVFLAADALATKVDSLVQRAIELEYSKPDSAIRICDDLLLNVALDEKTKSNVWEIVGIAQWVKQDHVAAIRSHTEALAIRKAIGYLGGLEHSYNNLGLNYRELGDPKLAMENLLEAQKIAEDISDSLMLAKILGNIGTLYEEQNADEEALKFHGMSLAILESGIDERVLANTLYNIALIYNKQGALDKARNFATRSHSIRLVMDDVRGIAQSLNLLGIIASNEAAWAESDRLFGESLAIYEQLGDDWGMSMVYGNLGKNALDENNPSAAIEDCGLSLQIAKALALEWEESACQCLARAHSIMGDGNTASLYWQRVLAIKDSIGKLNSLSKISVMQRRFEFEKEQLKSEAEIERQKLLRKAALGLGMMGIVLFFVAFRSYRSKQRDNELLEVKNTEISEQKHVIEEKNLHITDSIRYAERLQAAILPKDEMFAKHFADFHILYRPKDIVSGDFYWMEEAHGSVYLAAADCTGHGVPGAMVSMVGFQGLNKAVLEEKLTSPAAILQRLSDHVEEAFEKSGGSVKDGMDICLVAIDTKKRTVTYAGAHNALWILSSKEELPNANLREEENGHRMFELKADRRSIGGFMDAGSFNETTVELNEGDRLFLFSDGFADQFGGPQGKKLGSKRMRETVREMALSGNLVALGAIFEDWKGKEEQIDDVTVIAVSV